MKSNFSSMPSVTITRSKFNRKSQHKTSMKLGEITPIYIDEVLPGDSRKIDIASLIRMSTPVAPVMDNIFMDVYAFFTPARLCWTHWKEFMGENNSSAGIYSGTAYTVPKFIVGYNGVTVGSLGDHLGIPLIAGSGGNSLPVNCLPVRAYRLIYNRFFRDQNLIAPIVVNTSDTSSSYDDVNQPLLKAAKVSDYFTRALPYAQKGSPVTIPLGSSAPIKVGMTGTSSLSAGTTLDVYTGSSITSTMRNAALLARPSGSSTPTGDIFVDLSSATAATINQLRFAFQYQKLLEKDALYGTRYWELIKAHFSVTAPDASLQDPELLGHRKFYINIDQVVQTTGVNQSTPASNELGATAAVSVTGDAGNLFSKSFCEHGYLMIVAVARHDQTYSQGLERMWSRVNRTDFYFPVFANLGAQTVLNKEIYATASSSQDNGAFGFQEAWAEYRYKPSKATGLLNPAAANSLGYWTLTNQFSSLPTLSQSFIEQDRNALGRVLQTGTTGPDFICDFAFQDIAVRPMPLYSIPGLIDHH